MCVFIIQHELSATCFFAQVVTQGRCFRPEFAALRRTLVSPMLAAVYPISFVCMTATLPKTMSEELQTALACEFEFDAEKVHAPS